MEQVNGYVIVHKCTDNSFEYYRGCARGRTDKWAKSLIGAQVYRGRTTAEDALNTFKLDKYRNDCSVMRVTIALIED